MTRKDGKLKSEQTARALHYLLNTPGLVTDRILQALLEVKTNSAVCTYATRAKLRMPPGLAIERIRSQGYVVVTR
jgi:hypothetical protein